jgi:endonuclease-3 related protein
LFQARLLNLYETLLQYYGQQHWWPGETPFEVMVGAVLAQATAWKNAWRAIVGLKKGGHLSAQAIRCLPDEELAAIIRPSGYYNVKANRLKALANWLKDECGDNPDTLHNRDTAGLRQRLLEEPGIRNETADSILLYALGRPVFVIDAYTCRIMVRLGIRPPAGSHYRDYQQMFMTSLEADSTLFNEYHALIVAHGKNICRKRPQCTACCRAGLCSFVPA